MKACQSNHGQEPELDGYEDDQLDYSDVAVLTDKEREEGMWAARNEHRWIYEEDMARRWELYFKAAVEDGIMTAEQVREWQIRWAKCPPIEQEALA